MWGILESSRREGAHSPSVRKGYQHSIPLAANQLDTQAASGLPLWDIGSVPQTLLCACWGGEKPSADPEVTVNGFPQVSGMPMSGKARWFYSILMVNETMNIWTSGDTWACSQKKRISRDVPENAGRCNSSGRKRASATVSRLPHFGIVPNRSNRPVCQVFLRGQLSSLGASVPMHLLRKGRKTAGSSPEQVACEFSKWEYFEL